MSFGFFVMTVGCYPVTLQLLDVTLQLLVQPPTSIEPLGFIIRTLGFSFASFRRPWLRQLFFLRLRKSRLLLAEFLCEREELLGDTWWPCNAVSPAMGLKCNYFLFKCFFTTVDGWNPANQLRLVVCPIIYRVSSIPGGARFQPSTVSSLQ